MFISYYKIDLNNIHPDINIILIFLKNKLTVKKYNYNLTRKLRTGAYIVVFVEGIPLLSNSNTS